MAIVENNKFKSGMTHSELMAFKESSEIDWDSEEAKEV